MLGEQRSLGVNGQGVGQTQTPVHLPDGFLFAEPSENGGKVSQY